MGAVSFAFHGGLLLGTVLIACIVTWATRTPSDHLLFPNVDPSAATAILVVLFVVVIPFTVASCALFFARRIHQPIRFRAPNLVLGTVAVATIALVLFVVKSAFPSSIGCTSAIVSTATLSYLMMALLAARLWLLLFAFRLQDERMALQLASRTVVQDPYDSRYEERLRDVLAQSWFVSHRRLVSTTHLTMGVVLMTVALSVPIWTITRLSPATCQVGAIQDDRILHVLLLDERIALTIGTVTTIAFSVQLVGFQENFFIKAEWQMLSAFASAVYAVYYIAQASMTPDAFQALDKQGFTVAIAIAGYVGLVLITVTFPTVLSYRHRHRYATGLVTVASSDDPPASMKASAIAVGGMPMQDTAAPTLTSVLRSPPLTVAFGNFLKREFSIENLLFHLEGHEFLHRLQRFTDPSSTLHDQSASQVVRSSSLKLYREAQALYATYIMEGAPHEVSISSERRMDAARCLEPQRHTSLSVMTALCVTIENDDFNRIGQPNVSHLLHTLRTIIGAALDDSYEAMERDSFIRFLESPLYREAIHALANDPADVAVGISPAPSQAQLATWKSLPPPPK
ncbi:RGS domain-containing protein [Plasmodiophora brassicae]